MDNPRWRDVIIRALYVLGGDAPYSLIKPEIERRAERPTEGKWHQTVEGTVEQFSSDSVRGPKPIGFKGSDRDIFKKIGHGHWGIRSLDNPFVERAIADMQNGPGPAVGVARKNELPFGMVFVRKHWRRYPGDAESDEGIQAVQLDISTLTLRGAWVTNTHLEIEFQNGFGAKFPIRWITELTDAKTSERSSIELKNDRVIWPLLGFDVTTAKLFLMAASRAK